MKPHGTYRIADVTVMLAGVAASLATWACSCDSTKDWRTGRDDRAAMVQADLAGRQAFRPCGRHSGIIGQRQG